MIRTLHEIQVILFDGLPVPSTLFLFICACFPCEHVWAVIGRNVSARDTRNVMDQKRIAVDERDRIPQCVCFDYFASMRSRCRAIIDANGGHTRYESNIQTRIFPSRNVRYNLKHYLQVYSRERRHKRVCISTDVK